MKQYNKPRKSCALFGLGFRRLRFSSDADIVRLTNARIIIIISGDDPLATIRLPQRSLSSQSLGKY